MTKTETQTAAAENVMTGLLSIAVDALRKLPQHEALAALAGVESGSHVLTFGVSITGVETVIKSSLADVVNGVSIDLPTIRVHPAPTTAKPAGLH